MKNKKLLFILAAVAILAAVLIIVTQFQKPQENSENIIKIGAILPLTGNLAIMGEMERNALLLAKNECNTKKLLKNKKLEIIIGDSKGEGKEGAALAQRFIQIDRVNVLWSSLTGVSYSVEPIATANKILHIAFCMDPEISQKSGFVFRLYEGMMDEGQALMKYLESDKSPWKVGIIFVRMPATEKVVKELFVPEIKKQGHKLVFAESYEFQNKDFRTLLLKAKSYEPDYLIIYDYGFSLPLIFDALNSIGLLNRVKILGGWGFLYSLISNNVDPKLIDGVIVAGPSFIISKSEKATNFINEFKKSYGKEPNFDAGFAYDSLMILCEAIRKSKETKSEEIISNLEEIRDYEGVMGKLSISNRELKVDMVVGIIKGGKIIDLSNYLKMN